MRLVLWMVVTWLAAAVTGCGLLPCASGFVESGGLCIATAPKCDVPCDPEAHEVCDIALEPPSCVCAPGYSGEPCAWSGVLDAPGFTEVEPWSVTNGATVDPNEPATRTEIDPGIAFLRAGVVCNAGTVSQLVDMPPYEAAEPLVAEVTYKAENVYGLGVGFNNAWRTLPATGETAGAPPGTWETRRICLGEAAYGGEVAFQLGAVDQQPSCFTDPAGEIEVDRLDIIPAEDGECPLVGEVLNGQANPGEGGWLFIDEELGEDTDAIQAGFDSMAGPAGSGNLGGARIFRAAASSGNVGMATKLSIPSAETLPSPALRFWWKGTLGNRFSVDIGTYSVGNVQRSVGDLEGVDGGANELFCLPPWTHGNVVELGFSVLLNNPPQDAALEVDNVEIVSEPACGDSTTLFDPGFESAPIRTMGAVRYDTNQWVQMKRDPELARSGNGVLELGYQNATSLLFHESWVLVPPEDSENGPALVIWYNYPDPDPLNTGTPSVLTVRTVLGRAASDPQVLVPVPDWTRRVLCLPLKWTNRWYRMQIRVAETRSEDPNDVTVLPLELIDPPTRIYFDDFELTTSSDCTVE